MICITLKSKKQSLKNLKFEKIEKSEMHYKLGAQESIREIFLCNLLYRKLDRTIVFGCYELIFQSLIVQNRVKITLNTSQRAFTK